MTIIESMQRFQTDLTLGRKITVDEADVTWKASGGRLWPGVPVVISSDALVVAVGYADYQESPSLSPRHGAEESQD